MKLPCVLAIALSTASLPFAPAFAQTIYRCGNSYSQLPCAGGKAVDATDSRDKTQKAQTDAAVRRDIKAAGALEKNRTRQEAAHARAPRPYNQPADDDMPLQDATTDHTYDGGRKSRKSEFFTAKTTDKPQPKKKAPSASPSQDKPGNTRP